MVSARVGVLRHPVFKRVWFGQAASAVGDSVYLVALTSFVLVHGNGSRLGYVLGAEALAAGATLLLGGVVADRFPRNAVMLSADGLRLAATLALALAPVRADLVLVIPLSAVMGAGSAFFNPASSALTPLLVPADEVRAATAVRAFTTRLASVAGPGLAALLVSATGARFCFLLNAVSFLVSMLSLWRLPVAHVAPAVREGLFAAVREGFAVVRGIGWLTAVMLQGVLQVLTVIAPLIVLLPLYLAATGRMNEFGLLVALQSAGSLVGLAVAGRWSPTRTGLVALAALGLAAGELAGLGLGAGTVLLCVMTPLTGLGYSIFGVYYTTAIQSAVPEEALGRVFSIDGLSLAVMQPLSLALTPIVAQAWGVRATALTCVGALVVTTLAPLPVRGVATFGHGGHAS